MLTAISKICTTCGVSRPLDEFHRAPKGKHGRTADCKPCRAEHARRYYASQREAILDRQADYYVRERDRVLERQARYRESDRSRARRIRSESARRRRLAAPEMAAARDRRQRHVRRAQKLNAEVGPVDTAALWQHYGGNCPLCFTKIDRALSYPDPMSASLDHAVPLSKGGTHTQGNLQWTHLTCNVRKGNRD